MAPVSPTPRPLRGFSRKFGNLKVRPKFMVLHNLFFIALACGIYFSVVPFVESRMAQARSREVNLIVQTFQRMGEAGKAEELSSYSLVSGSAEQLEIPYEIRQWLFSHPGQVWHDQNVTDYLYRWQPETGPFYRLRLPLGFYTGMIETIKLGLFGVLGIAYVLAVLLLELVIMPRYVYQPLYLMLAADAATREGDREEEMIDPTFIPGDEIGQIMQSRNETVAELRRQEDDLAAAKRNLEAQDRLVSLGMLSASVAHEMNSPLTVLHGSIEKMLETTADPAPRRRLERMVRVTQRLKRISEGLLDFARVRKEEMEPVEVRAVIEEAWGLVGIDEKAAEIRFQNLVGPGEQVTGNSDRLVQVFLNLLRNAMHAVPRDGEVVVRSRATTLDGKPARAISVEDNGPGIPQEVLPDIFEAFVTTRLDARGTGLGLTVAEGIVSQHGGTITATNCPSGGARLEIILPAAVSAANVRESR